MIENRTKIVSPSDARPHAPNRLDRIAAWWRNDGAPAPDHTADRAMTARIAAFLCDHALAPSERHLVLARRYVAGEDHRLCAAIDARIKAAQPLSAPFLDALVPEPSDGPLRPDALAELADLLNARLAEGFRAISRSYDSARSFGDALGDEARGAAGDPPAAIERLLALTAAAVEQTQQLASELDATRRETGRLRDRLQAALREADEDHLTGLPNRRSFDARLHAGAGEVAAHPRCVALCDIDDFKRINDQHGHDTGDRVLKLVARQLATALGGDVLVARHGGEEFACLFEGATLDAACAALDDVREALAARLLVNQATGDGIGRVTVSAGVAAVGADPAAAMRAADAALYAAKHAGKNRVMAAEASPDRP
ncbi:MAG: diguanylate cyclase domain-containing protein [Sphingomonas sp.]